MHYFTSHLNFHKSGMVEERNHACAESMIYANELTMPCSTPANAPANESFIPYDHRDAPESVLHFRQVPTVAAHRHELSAENTFIKPGYAAVLGRDAPCAEPTSAIQYSASKNTVSFTDWSQLNVQQTLRSQPPDSFMKDSTNPSIPHTQFVSPVSRSDSSVSEWRSSEAGFQSPDSAFQSPNISNFESESGEFDVPSWGGSFQTHNLGDHVAIRSRNTGPMQYATTPSESAAAYVSHQGGHILPALCQDQLFKPSYVISSLSPPLAPQSGESRKSKHIVAKCLHSSHMTPLSVARHIDSIRPCSTIAELDTNLPPVSPGVIESPALLWSASTALSGTESLPSSVTQNEPFWCQPPGLDQDSPSAYGDPPLVNMSRGTPYEKNGLGLDNLLSFQPSCHGSYEQDSNGLLQLEASTKLSTSVEEGNHWQDKLSVLDS